MTGLLVLEDLVVRLRGPRPRPFAACAEVHALNGVSFMVVRGAAFGIVGKSGSGKSTAALAMVQPARGRVSVGGQDITALRGRTLRQARRGFQMVFQDPFSSLDPRKRAGRLVREPLRNQAQHALTRRRGKPPVWLE